MKSEKNYISNKKSQGLSLNTIIIAAIVLIVLIVIWSIFTGRIGLFTQEVAKCRGQCKSAEWCKYPNGAVDSQGNEDCNQVEDEPTGGLNIPFSDTLVCCIPLT